MKSSDKANKQSKAAAFHGSIDDIELITKGTTSITEVEICDIILNPHQPRRKETEIIELAESIKLYGLLQPVAAVCIGTKYHLVSGHRRLAAHKHIGLSTIRTNVIECDADGFAKLALMENTQRNDLHPIEVAIAIAEEPFLSMRDEDICTLLGYKLTKLRNIRAILRLVPEVLAHLNEHRPAIGVEILVELQKLPADQQWTYYQFALEGRTDRNDLRMVVRSLKAPQETKGSFPITRTGTTFKIDSSAVSDKNREKFAKELVTLFEKYRGLEKKDV